MKQSEAAKAFFQVTPVDGHLSTMIDAISNKVGQFDHLVDVEQDRTTGESTLKLVVYLSSGNMDDVYSAAQQSDRELAKVGVDFFITEG